MNRDQIVAQVNAVLTEGFEVDAAKLRPEAHLYHDLGIDSLDAIDMLVYIEAKLGHTVDAMLFKNVRTVGDIYDVMAQVLAAAPSEAAPVLSPAALAPPPAPGADPALPDAPPHAADLAKSM